MFFLRNPERKRKTDNIEQKESLTTVYQAEEDTASTPTPARSRKQRSKAIIKNTLSVVLVLIGLFFLLSPLVNDLLFEKSCSDSVDAYNVTQSSMDKTERDRLYDNAVRYNTELKSSTTGAVAGYEYGKMLSTDSTGVMSYIEIPKIGVSLPIYHGTSDQALASGVGHLEGTSLPVGGDSTHCVLSGHSGLKQTRLFDDLVSLQIGDTFKIETLGRVLIYKIDRIDTVDPSDSSKLKIQRGKDYCTLVTCTPPGINTHRLLVRGERVADSFYKGDTDSVQTLLSSQFFQRYLKWLVIGSLVLAVLLLIRIVVKKAKRHLKKDVVSADDKQEGPPNNNKQNEKSIIGTVLFFVFACLCFTISFFVVAGPVNGDLEVARKVSVINEKIQNDTVITGETPSKKKAAKAALKKQIEEYNASLVKEGQHFQDAWTFEQSSTSLTLLQGSEFGTIRIPDMNCELPLYLGASYANMANGAAVLAGTSLPIGGESANCVIAGHRGWKEFAYFRDIERLEPGRSKIYITNPWETLVYKVVEKKIIEPSDTDAVLIQKGKDMVTLVTCHPYMSTGYRRYIAYCERVTDDREAEKDKLTAATEDISRTFSDLLLLSDGLENTDSSAGTIALDKVVGWILGICLLIASIIALFRLIRWLRRTLAR